LTTQPPSAGAAAPAAPAGPLAAFWDQGKNALDIDKLSTAFIERDAAFVKQTERAKALPGKPEEYETKLPEGMKLPDNFKFDDKAIAAARAVAHKNGLDRQTFSELLGVYTQYQTGVLAAAQAEHQAMVASEVQKMGGAPAVEARHAPLKSFLNSHFAADEQAELNLMFATEAGTRTIEKIVKALNSSSMPLRVDNTAPQPTQPEKTFAEKMWPNGFSNPQQAKAS
jgi:hypothetical protein